MLHLVSNTGHKTMRQPLADCFAATRITWLAFPPSLQAQCKSGFSCYSLSTAAFSCLPEPQTLLYLPVHHQTALSFRWPHSLVSLYTGFFHTSPYVCFSGSSLLLPWASSGPPPWTIAMPDWLLWPLLGLLLLLPYSRTLSPQLQASSCPQPGYTPSTFSSQPCILVTDSLTPHYSHQ